MADLSNDVPAGSASRVRCAHCRFAAPSDAAPALDGGKLLECRADPPTVYPVQGRTGVTGLGSYFRPTRPEWWCGRFDARTEW